ncbi:unnamed protein product [Prorocentrum cordatum]|uniref:Uncharacterized protein n=1 Tax=Prorocentrum cordatum TaxID=2364126 RepID=A0ABN9QPK0_9DINO|nr:unnamed protein product [Polarella glacialis]
MRQARSSRPRSRAGHARNYRGAAVPLRAATAVRGRPSRHDANLPQDGATVPLRAATAVRGRPSATRAAWRGGPRQRVPPQGRRGPLEGSSGTAEDDEARPPRG